MSRLFIVRVSVCERDRPEYPVELRLRAHDHAEACRLAADDLIEKVDKIRADIDRALAKS